MATQFPKTENDFTKISGISEQKLNDFGEDFLMAINEYSMINNIADKINENSSNQFKDVITDDHQAKYKKYKKYKKKDITKNPKINKQTTNLKIRKWNLFNY